MFLSKGLLVRKYSRNKIIVQKYGSRYELKDEMAHIWLRARDVLYNPKQPEEFSVISSLCADGLMVEADKPNEYGKYYVLTNNYICVNPRKSGMVSLRGVEKEIMQWLQGGRRRLRVEELIYLIDHDVHPSDYEKDEFGVALSERIYRSRVHVENTLRREMSYAKSRDKVVNGVLHLFRKNRLYLV